MGLGFGLDERRADREPAWRHLAPHGTTRPRHTARSRAGSMRCPGHSMRCPGHSMRCHGHSKTAAARSLAAGRAATQRRCTPAPAAYLPRARARCARVHGICPGGSPAPALGGAGHESGGPAQGRAALHGSCPGGRCPGRALCAGLAPGRAGPRQGGPKAGGGGARSACVARCPRPCVTTYLTWPSRLRARVQVRSGGPELALELEKDGYAFLDMDEKAFKDAE